MMPDVVPPDLADALRRAGYRVAGPVGVGANGPAWAATAGPDAPVPGERVVVTLIVVPPGPPGERVRARLATLRGLRHEHLARIVDVVAVTGPGGPDRCAVLLAEVPGPNLAVLLAARPPLARGEAVTLLVPLAEALAAMHDAGIAHGDVSPANVIVRPDGRPVLVDLLGAAMSAAGARSERGTPGFAAPELERGDPADPAADVHALARVGLAALAGGGGPDLRALLARACSADALERFSAGELATMCFDAAPPEPIAVPDAAVLARTTLARLAVARTPRTPRSVLTVRGSRHGAGGRLVASLRVAAVVVATVAVAGGAVLAVREVRGAAPGDEPGAAPAVAARVSGATAPGGPSESDPVAAAVELTVRRAEALMTGDTAALDGIDLVGAGAHSADAALLAELHEAGQRIDGLTASVVSAHRVDAAAGTTAARVEVTSELTAYRRLTDAGEVVADVPAQPARTVVLTLVRTDAGWRVGEVLEPAP